MKLTGTEAPESFTLTLKNEFADEELASEYHIQVRKAQPLSFTPQLTPADALLFVVEPLTGQRIWPDADGAYALSDGFTYRYLLTRTGYAGRSGTLKAAYTGSGTLVLQIDEASVPVKDGAAADKDADVRTARDRRAGPAVSAGSGKQAGLRSRGGEGVSVCGKPEFWRCFWRCVCFCLPAAQKRSSNGRQNI